MDNVTDRPAAEAQRGFMLVLAALLLTGLMAAAMVAVKVSHGGTNQTKRTYHDTRVFYAAEGGSAEAQAWLLEQLADNSNPSNATLAEFTAPEMTGFRFEELSIVRAPRITGQSVPSGPFAGMTADIQPFVITSHATNTAANVDKTVRVTVNQQAIGMYQFGIFYDGDLEFFPPYSMDYHGRIHTNGDLYVGSTDVLGIDGQITVAGRIYNIPKDASRTYRGKARVTDPWGRWNDMSYDSRDPGWTERSLADWGGRVLDRSHKTATMTYPLPVPSSAIDVIRRGLPGDSPELLEKRFYYKAGLKIVDGVVTDSSGHNVALPAGIVTESVFYDQREQRLLTLHNINLAALTATGFMPANRIVYVSWTGASHGVRLTNGATLPSRGLSVATDNPLYIQGNYNSVAKKPASVLCDAFNVLSNNWTDANAALPLNHRMASATWVNTCVVAGNTPTGNGRYNGGAENLIRLHEKWVGHELTYYGSLACIWESQYATGDFRNASFVEAHREWGFDPALLDANFWPTDDMAMRLVSRARWEAE